MKATRIDLSEIALDPAEVAKEVEEGKTLAEVFQFSEERQKEIYMYALELFDEERFKDASDVLFVLTTMNPYFVSAWTALGLCEEKAEEWERAMFCYEMAMLYDSEYPDSYLRGARCALDQGNKDRAKLYLDLCEKTCTETKETASYFTLLKQLKRKAQ